MQKPESAITAACIQYLKGAGGDAYHVHGSLYQRAHEPDIDGSWYSEKHKTWLHLKIEVKTELGRPTKAQLHRLREYAKRGYVTAIVHSVEELKEVLDLANTTSTWYKGELLQKP